MTDQKPAVTFKRKRAITLPTFKFVVDVPLFVKILEAFHVGKVRLPRGMTEEDYEKLPSTDPRKREPPTLCRCVNLETGEEGQFIAASVLKTEIAEAYPDDSYVGKGFEIAKQKRKEGKQYDPYTVIEIELPDAPAAPGHDEPAPAAESQAAPATEHRGPARGRR